MSIESYRQVTSNQPVNNMRLFAAIGIGAAGGATLGAVAPAAYSAVLANPSTVAAATAAVGAALTPGGESITAGEINAINRGFGGTHEAHSTAETLLYTMSYYETPLEKAAAAIRSIAGGHMFDNGNKRTALAVAEKILEGTGITSKELSQVVNTVVEKKIKDVAEIVELLK